MNPATLSGDRVAQTVAADGAGGRGRLWGDHLAGQDCAVGEIMVFFCIPDRARDRRSGGVGGVAAVHVSRSVPPDARRENAADGAVRGGRPRAPAARGAVSTRRASGSSRRRWRGRRCWRRWGGRRGRGRRPRVWCWPDLWRAVREGRDDGPDRLSDAAARAALGLAFGRARDAGRLNATAAVADWPGFRRRVRDRIAGWTRADLFPDRRPARNRPDGRRRVGHLRPLPRRPPRARRRGRRGVRELGREVAGVVDARRA